MSKLLCSALALSLCFFVVQCTQVSTIGPSANVETKSVKVAIKVPATFNTVAAKALAVVSAPDMQSITTSLGVNGDTLLTGLITKIPVGSNRFFEVFVYGNNGSTEYYGSATADISSRDTTYVTIVLRKPYGTAVINGYIEEYYPDTCNLTDVSAPLIVDSWRSTDSGGYSNLAIQFGVNLPGTDSIVYDWFFAGDTDSVYIQTTLPTVTGYFITGGRYTGWVTASCVHGTSVTSEQMHFSIYGYKVYPEGDTTIPPFIDREPPIISIPWNNPVIIGKLDTLDYSAVQAFDAYDGNLSSKIVVSGEIIYGVPGTYTLIFTVSDSAGNTASAKLDVKISRRQHENYLPIPINY